MRIAVVGCGGIGNTHARAYKSLDDVELLYMIDRVPELAEISAKEFSAVALNDINEMKVMPDIASVATPPFAHTDVVLGLLSMGIPVFCEKPLTMNKNEARQILHASDDLNVPVGIGFKMRYEPVFQKAREQIHRLGKLYAVSVVKNQPYNPRPNGWIPRVGCMYELSVHEYDLVNWIAGITPQSVYAELEHDFGWERENRAYLDINYNDGIKGQLLSSYSPHTKFTFSDLSITYVGECGYMRIERPNRIFLHTDKDEVINITPKENIRLFAEELSDFVEAIAQENDVHPNARDGAEMTFLVESARESSISGKRVFVEKV